MLRDAVEFLPMQISMNADIITAAIHVLTVMGLTNALVLLDSSYYQMGGHVMVSNSIDSIIIVIIPSHAGVCSYNNGGCSHICSSESGNITCSCPTGMVMAFDGTTCVNSSVACGGELMAVNGVVALSIEDVSSDTNCVWVVRAPSSANVLQLEFQGAFNIMRSVSCKDSFLEVRDGDSALSILIGKFCGSISPEIITSSSSALYLRFHSSEMQVVKFNASFTATPAPVKGDYII